MRLSDIGYKEIINLADGGRYGQLSESELLFEPASGKIRALLIPQAQSRLRLFDHGDYLTLNTVNVNEVPVSKVVNDFHAYVKVESEPKGVYLLPDNTPVDFKYEDGYVSFTVKDFKIFKMFKIDK